MTAFPLPWHRQAQQMRQDGVKLAAIAAQFGKSVSGVSQALKGLERHNQARRMRRDRPDGDVVECYFMFPKDNLEAMAARLHRPVAEIDAVLARCGLPMPVKKTKGKSE